LLTIPQLFRETNLWLELEKSIAIWSFRDKPVELTIFPNLPTAPSGICLFPGRLKSLHLTEPPIQPKAIVCVLPYPNQAFWTLSAIWSGWLWGKEGVLPLRNSVFRQHYDLYWAAEAFISVFSELKKFSKDLPFFACVPEMVAGFLWATMTAGQESHLQLEGIALRKRDDYAQIDWSQMGETTPPKIKPEKTVIKTAILDLLKDTGEPCSYLRILCAGLQALEKDGALLRRHCESIQEKLNQLQSIFN
jgi:hypothetical protein